MELIPGADNAADLADNTLDMMVGRELKGDDFMSVNEMRDELYQCASIYRVRGICLMCRSIGWNRDFGDYTFMGKFLLLLREPHQ
jgi:hypothetical protein